MPAQDAERRLRDRRARLAPAHRPIGKLDPSSIRRGTDEKQLTISYYGWPLASADSDRTTTLKAGDRAPDAELIDPVGRRVRLFEIFRGPHFTAVAYAPRAADALDALDWPAGGAPLTRTVVDDDGISADHVLTDGGHTFRHAYGITDDALLLIRPDNYIAHIATHDMLAATRTAARAMTPATTDLQPEATR